MWNVKGYITLNYLLKHHSSKCSKNEIVEGKKKKKRERMVMSVPS